MDILDMIKNDHQDMISLFSELETTGPGDRRETGFKNLKDLMNRHMTAEERAFYPTLRNELHIVIPKSIESHNLVRVGLNEIDGTSTKSDLWLPRLLAVKDALMTHMTEEENLVFDTARKVLGRDGLQHLGPEFEKAKIGGDVSGLASIASATTATARGAGEEVIDRIKKSL